jgi:transposase
MPTKYTDEFKIEAVNQVVKNNYPLKEVSIRLGIHPDSLKTWVKRYKDPKAISDFQISQTTNAEIKRLQAELKSGIF